MKKVLNITGIFILAVLLALPMVAGAQGRADKQGAGITGMQMGRGQKGNMNTTSALTDEQKEQIEKLQKKFREDNADTIKALMTKRFDLNTVLGSDNPDPAKAKALQKEISDLNAKLAQARIELHLELKKIAPDANFGRGMGRGMGMMGSVGNEAGV